MKKSFIAIVGALLGSALLLGSCDLLANGLASHQREALANNIGTGSIASTWTYMADKTQTLSALSGNLVVNFTQPAEIALNTNGTRKDLVSLTVEFTQNGYMFEKTLTDLAQAGTLSADGLSYAIPMATVFAATTTTVTTNNGKSDDGKIIVTATVSGFQSTTVTDGTGAKRPIPKFTSTVKVQPLVNEWPSTLGLVTANGIDGSTVEFPVNSPISVEDLSVSDTITGVDVAKSNISVGMNEEGTMAVITFHDTANALKLKAGDVTVTLLNMKAGDYASTAQVLSSKSLTIKFSENPISLMKYDPDASGAAGSVNLQASTLTKFDIVDGGSDLAEFAKVTFTIKNLTVPSITIAGANDDFGLHTLSSDKTEVGRKWDNNPGGSYAALTQTVSSGVATFVFYYKPKTLNWADNDIAGAELAFKFVAPTTWDKILYGISGGDNNIFMANIGAGNSVDIEVTLP